MILQSCDSRTVRVKSRAIDGVAQTDRWNKWQQSSERFDELRERTIITDAVGETNLKVNAMKRAAD
jgi:hypothetical protein